MSWTWPPGIGLAHIGPDRATWSLIWACPHTWTGPLDTKMGLGYLAHSTERVRGSWCSSLVVGPHGGWAAWSGFSQMVGRVGNWLVGLATSCDWRTSPFRGVVEIGMAHLSTGNLYLSSGYLETSLDTRLQSSLLSPSAPHHRDTQLALAWCSPIGLLALGPLAITIVRTFTISAPPHTDRASSHPTYQSFVVAVCLELSGHLGQRALCTLWTLESMRYRGAL